MPATLEHLLSVRDQRTRGLLAYFQALIDLPNQAAPWYVGTRPLTALYVPPDVLPVTGAAEAGLRCPGGDTASAPRLAWEEVWPTVTRVLLLGPPGSGKTLLVRMTVRALAATSLAAVAAQRQGVHDVPIPICVSLADVVTQGSLPAAVDTTLRTMLVGQDEALVIVVRQHLRAVLDTDRCWLFLDALDEAPTREALQTALAPLRQAPCHLVVTSRPEGVTRAPLLWQDLAVYALAPFSSSQRQQFVATWFHDDVIRRERVHAVLHNDAQLDVLTRNALTLTLSCTHAADHADSLAQLPRRGDLYKALVHARLREHPESQDVLVLLQGVAWDLFYANPHQPTSPIVRYATYREAVRRARAQLELRADAPTLLADLQRTGLLVALAPAGVPDRVQFVHALFRDYLAAEHVASLPTPLTHVTHLLWEEASGAAGWRPEAADMLHFLAQAWETPPPLLQAFRAAFEAGVTPNSDPSDRPPPTLSLVPSGYIPRQRLEDEVIERFARPLPQGGAPCLVTLHGAGGMGKTWLALACATRLAPQFPQGVSLVRLDERAKSREAVAAAIGDALGVTGDDARPESLLTMLRGGKRLLVLDNYETVDCTDVTHYVRDLLLAAPGTRLLVTGRERVKLEDVEQVVDLNGGMTRAEAYAFFVARMQLERPGWQPTEGEAPALRQIIAGLEGMPLALEWAAAWAKQRSVAWVAEALDRGPCGPVAGLPPRRIPLDQPARHRSLTACLAWSYDLLDAQHQAGLTALGLFADTFSVETVAGAGGYTASHAWELVDVLHDAALIRRVEEGEGERYTMHPLTRAYVVQQLMASGTAHDVCHRYITYFCHLVRRYHDIYRSEHRAGFAREWRNALAAVHLAKQRGETAVVVTLADALAPFLLMRRQFPEAKTLLRRVWSLSRQGQLAASSLATTYHHLANLYASRGQYPKAELLCRRALRLQEALYGGESREVVPLRNDLAAILVHQSKYTAEVEHVLTQTVGIAERVLPEDNEHVAASYHHLARFYATRTMEAGWSSSHTPVQYAQAEALYQRALLIREQVLGPHHPEVAQTLNNLAVLYRVQRQYAAAAPLFQRALLIREQVLGPHHPEVAQTLNNLAVLYDVQQQYTAAAPLFQRALLIREQVLGPHHPEVARCYHNLALCYEHQQQYDHAERSFQRELGIWEQGGDLLKVARCLQNLAICYQRQQKDPAAAACYRRALGLLGKVLGPEHPDVVQCLAMVCRLVEPTQEMKP